MARKFNTYFSNVFTVEDIDNIPDPVIVHAGDNALTRSLPTIFHDVYHIHHIFHDVYHIHHIFHDVYHIHHIFHDVYHIYYLGPSHMPHDVFIRHSKVMAAECGHNTSI